MTEETLEQRVACMPFPHEEAPEGCVSVAECVEAVTERIEWEPHAFEPDATFKHNCDICGGSRSRVWHATNRRWTGFRWSHKPERTAQKAEEVTRCPNYEVILSELRAEEVRLEAELSAIRTAVSGLQLLAKRVPMAPVQVAPVFGPPSVPIASSGLYAGLGARSAISAYLKSVDGPRFPSAIADALLAGGLVTKSTKFHRIVTSTLAQMKRDGLVETTPNGRTLRAKREQQDLQMDNYDLMRGKSEKSDPAAK